MQSNIVQPLDNNDLNTGKNYIVNKLTMNPNGSINQIRFGIGIFYVSDGKLYQATDIDEDFTLYRMPFGTPGGPLFTRSTYLDSNFSVLDFYSGIDPNSQFYIVLLIRDNFDNELKPIYRKEFDNKIYNPGGSITVRQINYNVNLGDPNPYFTFQT